MANPSDKPHGIDVSVSSAVPSEDGRAVASGLRFTFPKEERLCGRTDIERLIMKGKYGEISGVLRFRHLSGTDSGLNRIMISVPKRNFKRAVRRNLLKRRIRESYRLQKHDLDSVGNDILIVYVAKEVLPYSEIFSAIGKLIAKINSRRHE